MKNGIKMMSAALLAGAMMITATPAEAGRNSTSDKGASSAKASGSKAKDKGKAKVKATTSRPASPKKRAKTSNGKAPKVSATAQSGYTATLKGKRPLANAGALLGGQGGQRKATASQALPSGSNPFASTSGNSTSAQPGPSNRNANANQAFGGTGANAATNRKAKASDVIGRSNPFASTSASRNSQPQQGVVNQLVGFFNSSATGAASVQKGTVERGNLAREKRGKGSGNG